MLSSNEIIAMLMGLHKDENTPLAMRVVMRIAADEIERLRRDYSNAEQDHVDCVAAYHNAKVEIERLRARVAELEAERAPAP